MNLPEKQPTDRDAESGKFKPGNAANRKGNPTLKSARLRSAFMASVSPGDIRELTKAAIDAAKSGDKTCLRLVLSYTLGRPPSQEMGKEFSQLRDEQRELRVLLDQLIRSRAQ